MANPMLVPGEMHRYRMSVGLVALVALLTGLVTINAQSASASTRKLCGRGQHIRVRTHGGRLFAVRNDFWGTRKFCLSNTNHRPNFTVVKHGSNILGGGVMAYPDVFTGCAWSICTPDSKLPARARDLRKPKATWHTTGHAKGRWNASFDLWFAKHNITTGQANGAELMIWLNTRRLPLDSTRIVHVDGVRWYLAHWRPSHSGGTWNYIQFRRVHRKRSVKNLRLGPFIHYSERLGLIKRRWWLLNIEAGFEIQRGGKGLSGRRFWARA
jgi:hypothetical protein